MRINTNLLRFFNSHPHKEDDAKKPASVSALEIFQLTSSQGG